MIRVLAAEPLVRWSYVRENADDIVAAFREHLVLTGLAVGLGFAISMVLALVAMRWRATYGPITAVCAALYSIPSIALFALLVPLVGLSLLNAEIALVGYTLLILLRNIVAGLDGVAPAVTEAADGMGYEGWRRFVHVDLPLATPAIVAGLRIATVTTIGLVTVTALIGQGGFGSLINDGLSRDYPTPIVVGTVLSVALAIAADLGFVLLERLLVPWGPAATGTRRARPSVRRPRTAGRAATDA